MPSKLQKKDPDMRIVRAFNSYGPRLDLKSQYSRVIPRFITQALERKPITVHGSGRQTRSFCYITDTIRAPIKVAATLSCKGEILNLGAEEEISIIDLAKMIKEMTKSTSPIVFQEARPDDPRADAPTSPRLKKPYHGRQAHPYLKAYPRLSNGSRLSAGNLYESQDK